MTNEAYNTAVVVGIILCTAVIVALCTVGLVELLNHERHSIAGDTWVCGWQKAGAK